jgi:O-antigen ligase
MLNKGITITPEVQSGLDSVVNGDGARMMAARSGYDLIKKHPMGLDQSKQAFQNAIIEECQGAPKIFISHAHNGWIDTGLAIGAPGLLLLLLVMAQYSRIGLNAAKKYDQSSPYGIALFASTILWAARGLLDSTLRDQMLEMQAFIFAFLLGIILMKDKSTHKEIS